MKYINQAIWEFGILYILITFDQKIGSIKTKGYKIYKLKKKKVYMSSLI